MHRSLTLVLAVAVVAGGCTGTTPDTGPTDGPSPPASPTATTEDDLAGQVAVVIHPQPSAWATAAEQGLEELSADALDGRAVRVVVADDPAFLPDITGHLAASGVDLVCVLGAGAAEAVREVAERTQETRFCVAPVGDDVELPSNVLPVDLRFEELGEVAGIALGADLDRGPVALLTRQDGVPAQQLRAGLRRGLDGAGLAGVDIRVPGALVDTESAEGRARAVLRAGARGIVTVAGSLDAVVRDVVLEVPVQPPTPQPTPPPTASPTGPATPTAEATPPAPVTAGLVGGADVLSGEQVAPPVLLGLSVHLDGAVALALEREAAGWDPSPATIGFAEGAFSVRANPAARSARVAAAVRDAVERLRTPTPAEDTTES